MEFIKDIQKAYNEATLAEKTVYLIVGIFLVCILAPAFFVQWFSVPPTLEEFWYKPWTIITYTFIHIDFIHVLSVSMVLYFMGNIALEYFNEKQFVTILGFGATFGALLYWVGYYSIPLENTETYFPLGGASAAVSAILIALTTKAPKRTLELRFIGAIPLYYFAVFWGLLVFLQLVTSYDGSALAHIGGILAGYLYVTLSEIKSLKEISFAKKNKTPFKKIYKNTDEKSANVFNPDPERINALLEKIHDKGLDSLSTFEKNYLERASKEAKKKE